MSPNEPRHPWSRLVAAARPVRDSRDESAPYGFATRVTAIAFSQSRPMASLLDRFALRALGIACLLAIAGIAVNYSALTTPAPADDHPVANSVEDPMSVLLDA